VHISRKLNFLACYLTIDNTKVRYISGDYEYIVVKTFVFDPRKKKGGERNEALLHFLIAEVPHKKKPSPKVARFPLSPSFSGGQDLSQEWQRTHAGGGVAVAAVAHGGTIPEEQRGFPFQISKERPSVRGMPWPQGP
jgi:hypothetical protein